MKYFVARGEHRRLDPTTRGQLRGSFMECSDGVTHYELAGPDNGELVLLSPGTTIPLFYWDGLAEELHQRGYRTLAYSGYGRGYSDRVRAVYDESLFVRQLSDLTTRLGLHGPWHVIGASLGALVAMAFTARHMEQTMTLTLVGPAGLDTQRPTGAGLLRHARLGALLGRNLGNRLLENHLSHNVRDPERSAALSAMVRACYEFEGSIYALFATIADYPLTSRQPLYAQTGQSPVPSLLLWGDEDQVTPITRLDEARELLTPVEWHVIRKCGHMAPYERPTDVAVRFDAFAQQVGRRAQR
ncbi:alpha/beta hydrolase [Nocardia beijingensis]|uniref:alpha/beta fold hydrolase n=1 Tax=Nocardia beijingensis TaxID=95162 RepID=UPI0033D488D7